MCVCVCVFVCAGVADRGISNSVKGSAGGGVVFFQIRRA